MITKFLQDTNAYDMYITGMAGTGKTTKVIEIVNTLVSKKLPFKVVAFTHKAKEVLESKLPILNEEYISTLHSFLKKRPTINSQAIDKNNIMVSSQYNTPEPLAILIVDEFSFVGDRDFVSIRELQDDFNLKVIYVGDANQLNPVKDVQAIMPNGKYHLHLDIIHRSTNSLQTTVNKLVEQMDNKDYIVDIKPTEDLYTDVDIAEQFTADTLDSKIILAYTNAKVQHNNAVIQGRTEPIIGDKVYIHSLRKTGIVTNIKDELDHSDVLIVPTTPFTITGDTKYNPFKTIRELGGVKYYTIDNEILVPAIFGTNTYNIVADKLATNLVNKNKNKEVSKTEYKFYKVMSDYISTMDFTHCTTIHKSQGSEYDNVYIDIKDLTTKCINPEDVIRLLYVAISRAKFKVFLN